MATPMEGASLVPLSSGAALVFGDETGAAPEFYDAATGTFLPVSSIDIPAAGATGVRLDDGRVFVAGGFDGVHASGRAMIFDPASATFVAVRSALNIARANPMMTRLSDGRVLIAGGNGDNGIESSAEIFDPASETFTLTGPMTLAQAGTATLLQDGQVLITGGATANGGMTATGEAFDPISGTFATVAQMRKPRRGHQAALLPDGRVLITGGVDATGAAIGEAEIFDPATATFSTAGFMIAARADHRSIVLASGDVLIVGGCNSTGAVSTIEVYSPAAGAFAAATDLGEPRWSAAVAQLADGRTLVAGGHGAAGVLTSAELVQGVPIPAAPIKATATLSVSPQMRQYSDRVTMTATVTPPTAAQAVTFKVGTQVVARAPVIAGTATVMPQLLVTGIGAKIVTAEFQASPGYQVPSAARPLTVLREDAQIPATPPWTVNTGCSTCRTTTVRLQATVNDISYANPASDPDAGDIGTATASFVNRATGATIATVPVIADASDHRTGKATYDWPVTLGSSSSQTFAIGVAVGGQYIRNNTADDMKVTVVRR